MGDKYKGNNVKKMYLIKATDEIKNLSVNENSYITFPDEKKFWKYIAIIPKTSDNKINGIFSLKIFHFFQSFLK